jgi:hypothetical protein
MTLTKQMMQVPAFRVRGKDGKDYFILSGDQGILLNKLETLGSV